MSAYYDKTTPRLSKEQIECILSLPDSFIIISEGMLDSDDPRMKARVRKIMESEVMQRLIRAEL